MTQSWPDIADVTAALESNDPTANASSSETPVANKGTEAEKATADETASPAASKSTSTPTEPSTSAPEQPDQSKPADPTYLAGKIKEDPRKFLATLPEDAIEAMQAVLYPKLHRTLSKRDEAHRQEIARLSEMNVAQVAALEEKIGMRIDEVLARTMEPEQFEEFQRARQAKADEEKRKNDPKPEEAARKAEVTAYVTQAWDMIADAGFPIPEDRRGWSDISEDVQTIWQAGWEEKTPLEGLRAMRAKARELKAGTRQPTPPRDPGTGQFKKTEPDLEAIVAERVQKALEDRDLRAGLAITGSRPGTGGGATTGKAGSWDENRRAMAEALRAMPR